jgi:dTDP-4-amino-4,6-dideoxygalactose transaminase
MEFKEIGSNFYTDKIQLSNELNANIIKNKYHLTRYVVYPSLGRNAILMVLKELKPKNKVALLPGYTCESVLLPFIYENYKLVYYDFNKDLTIDLVDFKSKLDEFSPGVILVHGFYGMNTFLTAEYLIQSAKDKGCIIIQDDTQTIFSDVEILSADYYLGSIRKWLEIPDGAFICSSEELVNIPNLINNTFIELIAEAFRLKSVYFKRLDPQLKVVYKKLFQEAQDLIDKDPTIYKMADLSKGILNEYDLASMKKKRIENFNFLHENISNRFKRLNPVISASIESNICPVYFPLYVDNRKEFQFILSENEIYATIIWPKSKFITSLNKETEFIYDRIIGIPCDQRYSINDMQRVIEVIMRHFI